MSSTLKTAYSAVYTPACSFLSLASGSAQQSDAMDNSSNLFLDAILEVRVQAGGSSPTPPAVCNIYLAGSLDGTYWPGEGSGNPDGVTGSDSSIALESPTNLILVGVINMPTASQTYVSQPISVAQVFGGVVPYKWAVIVENQTGQTFGGTGSLRVTGINLTAG